MLLIQVCKNTSFNGKITVTFLTLTMNEASDVITEQLVALLRLKNDVIAKLQGDMASLTRIDPLEHENITEKLDVCS